jgi:outer membrane immunogenic protein
MKRYIFGGIALLSMLAASPSQAAGPPLPVWSWTGWYVGANVGYSWGRSDTDAVFTTALGSVAVGNSFDMDGWIGGVQIGANWQHGNWVWGWEADIQASGQGGGTAFVCGPLLCNNSTAVPAAATAVTAALAQDLEWFATLRLRGGVTITPTLLAYVTGGLAIGGVQTDGTLVGVTAGGAVTASTFGSDSTAVGWTVGVGLEKHLSGHWTGKIEYLYIDFGDVSVNGALPLNAPPLTAVFNSSITDHVLRVGVNHKF